MYTNIVIITSIIIVLFILLGDSETYPAATAWGIFIGLFIVPGFPYCLDWQPHISTVFKWMGIILIPDLIASYIRSKF